MTCLNITDPQVQKYITFYGELLTKKALDLYNENPTEELTDNLMSTLIIKVGEGSRKLSSDALSKTQKEVEKIGQALLNETEFPTKLRTAMQSFDWKVINYQETRDLLFRTPQLRNLEKYAEQALNISDAKKAAESLMTYLYEMSLYFKTQQTAAEALINNEEYTRQQKMSELYHLINVINSLETQLSEISSALKPIVEEYTQTNQGKVRSDFIGLIVDNVNSYANKIKLQHSDYILDAISEEFTSHLGSQLNNLVAQNNSLIKSKKEEIEKINKEILFVKQSNPNTEPKTLNRRKELLLSDISKLEERKKHYSSKENFKAALKNEVKKKGFMSAVSSTFKNSQDLNVLSSWFESAALSSNLITGSVGTYVNNLNISVNNEQERVLNVINKLYERAVKINGGSAPKSNLDLENFAPYLRQKVDRVTINSNGELVTTPVYVFNTEMDEISFQNDLTKKRHELQKLEKDLIELSEQTDADNSILENKRKEIELKRKEISSFEKTHRHYGYTEEYHTIMDSLGQEAREELDSLQLELQLAKNQKGDTLTGDYLNSLKDIKRRIARLESLTYENGTPKTGRDEIIAKQMIAWNKAKRNAAEITRVDIKGKEYKESVSLFDFVIEEEDRREFDLILSTKKEEVAEAKEYLDSITAQFESGDGNIQVGAINKAREDYRRILKDYNAWYAENVIEKISNEYYETRSELIDAISEIQEPYLEAFKDKYPDLRSTKEIWEEIFNTLKGYRKQDGEYDALSINNELSSKIKELQIELAKTKDLFSKEKTLTNADREALNSYFEQLGSLQETYVIPDYHEAVKRTKAESYSKVINDLLKSGKVDVLELRNAIVDQVRSRYLSDPEYSNLTKTQFEYEVLKRANIELATELERKGGQEFSKKLQEAFENSEWFKANHYKGKIYDTFVGVYKDEWIPLYHWNKTRPSDDYYILKEEPSSVWMTPKVNEYFIDKDYKYKPGRTQLRKSSSYKNKNWSLMTEEQRELTKDISDFYAELQQGQPNQVRRGLMLPSVQREILEFRKDYGLLDTMHNLKDTTKAYAENFYDSLVGKGDEEELANGDKKHLYLRYTRNLPADQVSLNVFRSLALYGYEAVRYNEMYKKMPFIHGLESVLESNFKDSNVHKLIENFFLSQLYGQSRKKTNEIVQLATGMADSTLAISAKLVIGYNLPAAVKNFAANLSNSLTQAGMYNISRADILKGMAKGAKHIPALYMSKIQSVTESDELKLIRHFAGIPDLDNNKGAKLAMSGGEKALKLIPGLNVISFFRQSLDFESRIGVFYALSDSMLIEDKKGNKKPFLSAFYVKDGQVEVHPDFDEQVVAAQKALFIGNHHRIQSFINGAYSKIDKGAYTRYALGRYLMYMKQWLAYQVIARIAPSRRISYGGGVEYDSMYAAFAKQMLDIAVNLPYVLTHARTYFSHIDPIRAKATMAALYDTLAISVLYTLGYILSNSLRPDSKDDDDDKVKYFFLYNLAYLSDELETLHPVFGPMSFMYSRIQEKTDKGFGEYLFSRYITLPFQTPFNIAKEAYSVATREDINLMDEFIQRNKEGNAVNPKRVLLNPSLVGKSELVAQFLLNTQMAKNLNYAQHQEYLWRTFDHYNPKWFISSVAEDKETVNERINELERYIKTLKQQIKLSKNKEQIGVYTDLIDETKDQISRYKKLKKQYVQEVEVIRP